MDNYFILSSIWSLSGLVLGYILGTLEKKVHHIEELLENNDQSKGE